MEKIQELKESQGVFDVSDDEIKSAIDNLAQEINQADEKAVKRTLQVLFEEVRIHPKEEVSGDRLLEVKGVYLPLTGINVASPRGFEFKL
jgi:hypothetical protein